MNPRTERNLQGVHPALVGVVKRALDILHERGPHLDFIVTEGLRSKEKQAQLVRAGASRTYNSRHLTGHAVDVAAMVDGEVRWDWPLYTEISHVMNQAAAEQGVQIVWGGTWASLRDGPHFELDRQVYAA